jgi:hypothetical protein
MNGGNDERQTPNRGSMVSYSCRVVLVSGSDWFGLLDFWRLGVKQLLRKKIQQWENAYCILQAAQIQNANQGLEETLLFQSNELKIELLHLKITIATAVLEGVKFER